MMRDDKAQGFRQVAGTRLALAVAKGPVWDEGFNYEVPAGYRWATTAEVCAEAKHCTEKHDAYYNQCGWKGFTYPPGEGHNRMCFVCSDTKETKRAHAACANIKLYPMAADIAKARKYWAGLMCIKE
jgi:hypothetical protein